MILILKHIDIEGPGTLGDFLTKKGRPFQIVDLKAKEALPEDLKGIEAVVALGGPMNVEEERKHSFLKREHVFIQNVLEEKIPYLGICLGAQLLAKAAGARVVKSPFKEVGWFEVELTPDGQKDPFFQKLPKAFEVFHWHEDMFMVPSKGTLLATGSGCPHQAFRFGKNAYGIQFHCEITDVSIREWSNAYVKRGVPGREEEKRRMLEGYKRLKPAFDKTAVVMYENLLRIVDSNRHRA